MNWVNGFWSSTIAITIVTLVSGCAYSYKYPYSYKVETFGKHVAITTDASKRSMLLNTEKGKSCSEPAPDAIGTIATSLAAQLSAQADQPTTGTDVSINGNLNTSTQTAITRCSSVPKVSKFCEMACTGYAKPTSMERWMPRRID